MFEDGVISITPYESAYGAGVAICWSDVYTFKPLYFVQTNRRKHLYTPGASSVNITFK